MRSRLRLLYHVWRRPWADQWLFAQAYIGLGLSWAALRALPFRRIAAHLGAPMSASPNAIDPAHADVARRVSWAVQYASALTPWPSVCLPQAITAKILLRRHRVASTLYIGAAFDERQAFLAHAWLRCGSLYVTGEAGHEHYGVLASFAD